MREFTTPSEALEEIQQQNNYFTLARCSECRDEVNCYISKTICKTDVLCIPCAVKKGVA